MSPAAENVRERKREQNARARAAREARSSGIRIISVRPATPPVVERYPIEEWKVRYADEYERLTTATRMPTAYGQVDNA